MDPGSVPLRSVPVVKRKTGDEYVLVPVTDNIADMESVYTLNETAAFIWDQIDGHRSIAEIVDNLVNEFDIDSDTAAADVLELVERMRNYLIIK